MDNNGNMQTSPNNSLREIMEKHLDEPRATGVSTDNSKMTELEQNPEFKSAPQEVKDAVRMNDGIIPDTELDALAKSLKESDLEIVDVINRDREQKGLDTPLTVEKFKSSPIDKIATLMKDETDNMQFEFEQQLFKLIDEPTSITSSSAAETEEDALKAFEKNLEDAIPTSFIDDKIYNKDSAALDCRSRRNTDYEDNMKSILSSNNIKYKTTKKANLKSALLQNFINRYPHVTTPLVNSGFYVTISGASVPEILQMQKIKAKTRSELELKRLGFIVKHIVGSSIGGKLTLTQLSKAVFFKDLQTLYYNYFTGSFPYENIFPVQCASESCNATISLTITPDNVVLNADEFSGPADYILYKNTDISEVLMYSKVSREKEVIIGDRVTAILTNPTIFDVTFLMSRLDDSKIKNLQDYEDVIGYLTYIKKLGLPDEDGEVQPYVEIDEILEILSAMDGSMRDELDTHIEEYSTTNTIRYGLKPYKCPKCGRMHPEQDIDMAELLFTTGQIHWMMEKLAKLKKKDENLKK